jgi:hypothetical protein
MSNITVGRYTKTPAEERATWPPNVGEPSDHWQGWIAPEGDSPEWCMFIDLAGRPLVILRD